MMQRENALVLIASNKLIVAQRSSIVNAFVYYYINIE
jgi:hypothetical protein